MPIVDILVSLVAYCQNQGVLSSDSSVYQEIADIAMCDASDVEEIIG
jgi:hypothetical protein